MQESNIENYSDKRRPKYVDLLDEDKSIAGQKYVCLSFVSPENILKQKEHFFFQEFLKNYDFEKEPFGKQLFVDNLHAEKVVLEKEY